MRFYDVLKKQKKNAANRYQRRTSLRLLAVLLSFVFSVTLFPADWLTIPVQAAETQTAGTTLIKDGGEVTWDFRDAEAPIYTAQSDGSLSVTGTFSLNSEGHGADINNGTVFTLNVPKGQTTLTFGVCAYGSSTAKILSGSTVLKEGFLLKGNGENDGKESSIQYTSDTDATITIEVSGSGFLHYIKAETITPPQVATVSGTVSPVSGAASGTVAGQQLLFTDGTEETVETEIAEDGTYSVSLPIGHVYTVSFANADVYEVTDGGSIDLTDVIGDQEITGWDITYRMIWDTSKTFNFQIAETAYTVTPGSSSSKDFNVTASGGDGSVELATTDTAIIWADLRGAGVGSIREDTIEDVSDTVDYEVSGNTVTFTYKDTKTSPMSYTIQVKDNSASGTPHADGRTKTYDFKDGSIVSELYQGAYSIRDGKSVSSTDGLVTVTGNKGISYNGSHGIMIKNKDTVSVKVAGDAEIALELCAYTAEVGKITVDVSEEENGDTGAGETGGTGEGTVSPSSVDAKGAADGDKATFTYTGGPATLTFTYTGGGPGYLHSVDVTNQLPETQINEQAKMPDIKKYNGSQVAMTVIPVGQQLTLEQEGGSMATGEALSDTVSYYGFDATADCNKLEADITLTSSGNSSSNGVFFGAFNGEAIETVGIRNHTNLRAVYSDETGEVNAGRIDGTIEEGQTVHFTAEKKRDEDGKVTFVITATPQGGETYTSKSSESNLLFDGNIENAEISFGFILADAEATVTNIKYYAADGTVLYDQNNCYSAIGEVPVVTSVQASVADTRDAIIVSWNSEEMPYGDARFVVQVREVSPGESTGDTENEWTTVAETTESSYTYPATEPGTYKFHVGGKVGSDGKVTYCERIATVTDYLPALPTPVVTLEAHESSIDVSWTRSKGATDYKIYRYSSDEGPGQAKVVYTISDPADAAGGAESLTWTDTSVTQEVPYYYYVTAHQYSTDTGQQTEVNSSNPSATVWAMASAGHTGEYVYEDASAGINLTECPDDTVTQLTVAFGGTADRAGTLSVRVNDVEQGKKTVAAGGTFRLVLPVEEGRNEIELLFTDNAGNVTRETHNVVCLTNYDSVVDAAYTGKDGTRVNGIPTYRTVQAAVNAVPENNAERQVIYIKKGDYEERLTVESPYISLIGEDEEQVRIHCYPADLYPGDTEYEAGGDMSKRCATYVMSTATGFSAENLTFANDYVYGTEDNKSNKSADALRCDADDASFVNVTLSGVQDTLYMDAGHQYYYQCRIEGLIDFIYSGDNAKALFRDCDLVFVYEETHPEGGYVCAPRTAADAPYGLIFDHCRITSEEGCVDGTFRLARPWGPDGCIYWLNCYMGSALDKEEPYADMSGNAYLEARFFECGSYGPGYAVNATRRQISPTGAENLLAGLGWTPEQISEAVGAVYIGNVVTPEPGEPIPEEPSTEEPSSETPPADDTTEGPSSGTPDGDDAAKNPSSGTPAADNTTAGNGDDANEQPAVSVDSVSKLETGMLVVDNQYNAVFEVCGSASEGFTLTCVRPASRNTSRVKIPAKVKVGKEEYPVTAIAAGAFKGKKELRKVIIGANVTRIGKKAFQGCQSLKKLVIKSKKLKKIGAKAFRNSNPALKIKVPGGRKKAYRKLFKKVGVRL